MYIYRSKIHKNSKTFAWTVQAAHLFFHRDYTGDINFLQLTVSIRWNASVFVWDHAFDKRHLIYFIYFRGDPRFFILKWDVAVRLPFYCRGWWYYLITDLDVFIRNLYLFWYGCLYFLTVAIKVRLWFVRIIEGFHLWRRPILEVALKLDDSDTLLLSLHFRHFGSRRLWCAVGHHWCYCKSLIWLHWFRIRPRLF